MFENPYLKGVLGSIGSAVCFSLMAYLIRLGEGISFFTSSFYRFAVGLCLIVSLALFKKIRIDFSNTPILFLRGLLGSFAVLLFYMSIVKIGIAKGTAISYT
ncbi:MAG TPA: EamA family transporter, partial [Spirochaetia bacterium]|nr:EamA family transporter [Spirochaetia bacterium]